MPARTEANGEGGEEDRNPLGYHRVPNCLSSNLWHQEYEGERNEQGERHGQGKALLPNGDMYVGSYCKGSRHGKGLYVFRNGARYEGEWRRGLKHGHGTFWYPDGTKYEGDWKRDTKYGFGAYYYANKDVYEGSWKKNLRHGMGTYLFEATGTKFNGTWIKDRMQGPGQLIHPRHRFHGFWELNQPYGRGCFTFESNCMQHGHYIHIRDPDYDESREEVDAPVEDTVERMIEEVPETTEEAVQDGKVAAQSKPPLFEEPLPLKKGVIPLWRARYITAYNPDLLPLEPAPLQEEASTDSLTDKCDEDLWLEDIEYLKHEEGEGEYHGEGIERAEYFGDDDAMSADAVSSEDKFQ
nr:radial spoke head 1 homolog [Neodiprion pinetum]